MMVIKKSDKKLMLSSHLNISDCMFIGFNLWYKTTKFFFHTKCTRGELIYLDALSAHRLFKIISFSTQNAQEQEGGIDLPEFCTRTSAKGLVLVCKVDS